MRNDDSGPFSVQLFIRLPIAIFLRARQSPSKLNAERVSTWSLVIGISRWPCRSRLHAPVKSRHADTVNRNIIFGSTARADRGENVIAIPKEIKPRAVVIAWRTRPPNPWLIRIFIRLLIHLL